jgi:uncharacterized BrkB/YihY/UPF0761 family membrane protein
VLGLRTLPVLHRLLAPGAAPDGESQQRHAKAGGDAGREAAQPVPGARRGVFGIAKVSLLLSAAVAAFGAWLSDALPMLEPVMSVVDIVISTAVLTLAFWLLIRFLPDAAPRRRAVWIGALVSALLFAIGKHLIGRYLARGAVASAYGAAGSFIVVVLWVYYSAQILLLGAEVARALDAPQRAAERAGAGDAALDGASTA